MKKNYILIFLILGIFPCFKGNHLTMGSIMETKAQNYGDENNLGDWGDHGVGDEFDLLPEDGSPVQIANECVFEAFSIALHYDSEFASDGDLMTYYATEYGQNPVDGVQESDFQDFLNEYFDTNDLYDFSDIQGAIDDNHLILGALDEGGGLGHEVVITGYNDDGTVTYFDPATGGYENRAAESFFELKEVTSSHIPTSP